jgi:hypothetical protein
VTGISPFHPEYTWPKLGVVRDGSTVVVDVHCLCINHRQFGLLAFIGCDRQRQFDTVTSIAEEARAEVIIIKGRGLTNKIVSRLMWKMIPAERPGEWCTFIPVDWPNKIQRRVLNKLPKETSSNKGFHEKKLAKRLCMPVEEVHRHLEVLVDIGLVDEA